MPQPSTIVVVGPDDPTNRDTCRVLSDAGFAVLAAPDGPHALAQIRALGPRLIAWSTPPGDEAWKEWVRDMRREPHAQQTSLLLLARGPVSPADHAAALEAGADDAVDATGDRADLLARVRVSVQHAVRLQAAQHDTEWRFRELAENIEEVFYTYDVVNDRLLYANSAFEQIWGRPVHEAYHGPASYLEAAHPDDRPIAEDAFRRQLTGEETTVVFRIVRPDGEVRWISEHAQPVIGPRGQVERIVGTMRDITRATHHERLQAWGARVFESISTGVALPVILEQIVRGAEQFTPHALASILLVDEDGRRLRHGAAPGLPEAYNRAIDGVPIGPSAGSCGTAAHRGELVVVDDIGADALWEGYRDLAREHDLRACWSMPVRGSRGEVIATFALYYREPRTPHPDDLRLIEQTAHLTSIAIERDRRERALRTQAALLDKAQDAILVRDLDHRVVYWNQSAERLYGWSSGEATGRSVRDLLYDETGRFDAAQAVTLAQGEWLGELEKLRKDGQRVEVESRWTLLRNDRGEPHAILVIDTDITERKRLESQFLRAQRLESIGTLAGGIAHDLNNLLAPIMMGVGLLQKLETRPDSLEILRTIQKSTSRGADLVRQMLSFSRGVDGEHVTVAVDRIVREVATIVASTFPKDIRFTSTLPPDLRLAHGDPTQLTQVLLNLCVNARDAMPGGGDLTIVARNITLAADSTVRDRPCPAGPYIEIEVSDTGTGMPRRVLDRIFDPFFTTKEPGRGTGLGLPTVLGIVRGHGGFVDVHSEPGRGSTFRVCLPAAAGDVATADPAALREQVAGGRGELVLVVDDEAAILKLTQRTLEMSGYRVLTARHGAVALDLFGEHRHDIALVVTDLMMPVMDGAALVSAIQRVAPATRIIASSGLNASDNVDRVTSLGVRHFLPKPYKPDVLLSLVRTALDERSG